jgi:hypothetical protein
LVVRQALIAESHSDRRVDLNIDNISFIAAPHVGSAYAEIGKKIPVLASAQIEELAESSPIVYQIVNEWKNWVKRHVPMFCHIQSIFAVNDGVISPSNAVGEAENPVPIVNRTHTNICHPEKLGDELVVSIAHFLQATGFAEARDKEDLVAVRGSVS